MMKTCKDCMGYNFCDFRYTGESDVTDACEKFKDKTLFIELPCKVGDTVYTESAIKGRVTSFKAPDVEWIIENKTLFGKELFLDPKEAAEKILKSKEALTQPCYNAEVTISEKDKHMLSFFIKDHFDTYGTLKSLCGQISKLIACEALGDGEYSGTAMFSEIKPDGSEEYIDSDEFFLAVNGPFIDFEY